MHKAVVGRAQQRPRGAALGIILALAAALCAGLGVAEHSGALFTQACAELTFSVAASGAALSVAAVQGLP
jgi:hypothetical protein